MSDKSLIFAFGSLNLETQQSVGQNKFAISQTPNDNRDLPCRMPQTAGDEANSDDTDTSSDIIIVVDSSNYSTDVSVPSTTDITTSSQSVLEIYSADSSSARTIPETESERGSDDHGEVCIMDNFESTPIKRKHGKDSKARSCLLGTDLNASPVLTTTRSGRTVRALIDHKFDYSSEPQDDDLDDSDDPDFGGTELDNDDDVEQCDRYYYSEPSRKHRRISIRSSCCSSDGSSVHESDAIIYLDLSKPIAIVTTDPMNDEAVELDSEFKTRLNKFLGLIAPQRRLYNPLANFEVEDNHMDEDDPPSILCNRLWSANNNVPLDVPAAKPERIATPSRIPLSRSHITNDMKLLLIDDMVQRANANYFESQTPAHIKEPIDMSGLPSAEQRAINCQKHQHIVRKIGPYTGLYNFVDSLRPSTPLRMCHPLAVEYRKRDFIAYKGHLAKTLFDIVNHIVFYCSLRFNVMWRGSMNTPSSIEYRIEAGGQRSSSIILWKNIKHPSTVIKELLHEMCHTAAFVFHGETGHGDNCRKWAYRAKSLMPELPVIDDCNGTYKYVCLLCRGRSFGRMKFEDEVHRLRCHYCQFEVNVEPYAEDNVHNLTLTDQLVTPYKEFVRANYNKCEQSGHNAKMRALNLLYKEHTQQTSSN